MHEWTVEDALSRAEAMLAYAAKLTGDEYIERAFKEAESAHEVWRNRMRRRETS